MEVTSKLSYIKLFVFAMLAVVILFCCTLISPLLFSGPLEGELWNDKLRDFALVKGFTEIERKTHLVSMYRANPERLAEYEWSKDIRKLHVSWKVEGLFAGIHTASKATPIVDDTGIYFGSDTGVFYKYSHLGSLEWIFRAEGGGLGIHGSALLDEKNVFFGTYDGNVYCLEKKTGKLVWKSWVANAIGSSPLLWNDMLIFAAEFSGPKNGYLVALDAKNGKRIWNTDKFGEQVHASPTLAADIGIIGLGNNAGDFLGIDLKTGSILWHLSTNGPIKDTAFYANGRFCFGGWDHFFRCVNGVNGTQLLSVDLGGKSMSSPVYDRETNKAYILSASGYIFKINLDEGYVEDKYLLGNLNNIGRLNMFSPVLLKGVRKKYLLSTCFQSKLCFFDVKKLNLVQQIDIGGAVTGTASVWRDSIYVNVDMHGPVKIK